MASKAELHNEIVHDLLRALLGESSVFNISFKINIKEGAHAAKGHCRAVLLLDCRKVAKISPLHGFSGVGRGLTDVKAVHLRHFLETSKEVDLSEKLLVKTNVFGSEYLRLKILFILFLFLDQTIHTVKSNAAVVTDNSSASVCVGKTGDYVTAASQTHLVGIRSENAVIVSSSVSELLLDLTGQLISVCLACLTNHSHAAKGVNAALQGAVCLKTNDYLVILINVSGRIACQGRHRGSIYVKNSAHLSLKLEKVLHLIHHGRGARGCLCKKCAVARIFLIVALYKIADVYFIAPRLSFKSIPILVFHKTSNPPTAKQKGKSV